jgi:hypothetical protein
MSETKEVPTLFTVRGTPVKVEPIVLGNLLAAWGGLAWLAGRRRPDLPWPARLLIGMLGLLALLAADLGHAIAHTVSARYAGAPVDEILVTEGMPRTFYRDNEVPPHVHRLRALGGPIYSAVSLLGSLALRASTPSDSVAHDLANIACLGHGFILAGSLMPLPFVDGGTIVKWTLVERGCTPAKADTTLKRVDLALGTAATTAGLAFGLSHRWLLALGLVASGAIAIGAALDKIR